MTKLSPKEAFMIVSDIPKEIEVNQHFYLLEQIGADYELIEEIESGK